LWNEVPASLNLFITLDDAAPSLDTLPADRTWLILTSDQAAESAALTAKGFHIAIQGQTLAVDVDSPSAAEAAINNGAEWLVGRFATHPPGQPGSSNSAGQAAVMRLLALVAQDADADKLGAVFKHEPELSYHLLRLVNSVSMGMRTTVTSFNHALMVLGRRQLERWLQILLYASHKGATSPNSLMLFATMRGQSMERLAAAMGWASGAQDQAFMTGMFSLLDSLLGLTMGDIVKAIPLPHEVQQALVSREGDLGQLLTLIDDWQAGNSRELPDFVAKLGAETTAKCQLDALRWTMDLKFD
jgi:c-di-GMP-related signal transduction protein